MVAVKEVTNESEDRSRMDVSEDRLLQSEERKPWSMRYGWLREDSEAKGRFSEDRPLGWSRVAAYAFALLALALLLSDFRKIL